MTFEFFQFIHHIRQSNAQYRCVNIIGNDVQGYCLDAHDYLPAGSTLRLDPDEEPEQKFEPCATTSRVWREA